MTLAWSPVSGVSSYVLSWRPLGAPGPGGGELGAGVGWQLRLRGGLLFNRVLPSAEMPGASQTLPGSSSSHRVTGLEPGVSYIFSLTPVQDGVQHPEAAVTQSPGMVSTAGGAHVASWLPASGSGPRWQCVHRPCWTWCSCCMPPGTALIVRRLSGGPWSVWCLRLDLLGHRPSRFVPRGSQTPACPSPFPSPGSTRAAISLSPPPPPLVWAFPWGLEAPPLPRLPVLPSLLTSPSTVQVESHMPKLCAPPPQVGLLSYSHRPSPLLPLNSSHDIGTVLEKIRSVPYVDPSGSNLGKEGPGHGLLGHPPRGPRVLTGPFLQTRRWTQLTDTCWHQMRPGAAGVCRG